MSSLYSQPGVKNTMWLIPSRLTMPWGELNLMMNARCLELTSLMSGPNWRRMWSCMTKLLLHQVTLAHQTCQVSQELSPSQGEFFIRMILGKVCSIFWALFFAWGILHHNYDLNSDMPKSLKENPFFWLEGPFLLRTWLYTVSKPKLKESPLAAEVPLVWTGAILWKKGHFLPMWKGGE